MVNHCKFPFLRTSWRSFKGMLKSMPSALGIRWSLAAVPGCVGAEWPAAVGAGCSALQHLGEFEWEKCLRLAEFSEIGKLPFCNSVLFRRFGFWDLEMNSSRCSDVPNLCLNPSSWHILTYFFYQSYVHWTIFSNNPWIYDFIQVALGQLPSPSSPCVQPILDLTPWVPARPCYRVVNLACGHGYPGIYFVFPLIMV